MSLSHVEPELAEAYLSRAKTDAARIRELAERGDRRARTFLASGTFSGFARVFFVVSVALSTEDLLLGSLVLFLGTMHGAAFRQVEANLFTSRWKRNLGGVGVNLMVFSGMLYAVRHDLAEVAFPAALVAVTFLSTWALWLKNYTHLTGRPIKTNQ